MKKFVISLCVFSLLFNFLAFSVYAKDDDDDDGDDPYTIMAKAGLFPTSDENYAEVYNDVIRTHVGEGRHHVYQDLYDKYVGGLITFRDYVKDVHLEFKNDGINENEFYTDLVDYVKDYQDYFTIPTFPSSRFGRMYQENLNGLNYITNVINNNKLTLVWSNSDWGYDNYLGGASRDLSDAVFINVQNTNPDNIIKVYNGYYNFSRVGSGGSYVAHICDFNGDNFSVALPPNAGSRGDVSYEYGSYCKMLIYSDPSYSVVPVFRSKAAYLNYLNGTISFYSLEYLKSLNLEELQSIDYKKLQNTINNAVANGTWLTANELQGIINNSLLGYLEQLGIDTKDILLRLQSGLFDENGVAYLKLINDKLTIIINNMGGSSGGSTDLSSVESKLDTIIFLLGKPEIDIGIEDPNLEGLVLDLITKFPFSIPTDIYLLVSVIGVEPEKPDLVVTFPVMYSEDTYEFTIDLSWYDAIQSYWFFFCDVGFLFALLTLTIKLLGGIRE